MGPSRIANWDPPIRGRQAEEVTASPVHPHKCPWLISRGRSATTKGPDCYRRCLTAASPGIWGPSFLSVFNIEPPSSTF